MGRFKMRRIFPRSLLPCVAFILLISCARVVAEEHPDEFGPIDRPEAEWLQLLSSAQKNHTLAELNRCKGSLKFALHTLLGVIEDRTNGIGSRSLAIGLLEKMDADAKSAIIPVLERALRDEEVDLYASVALWKITHIGEKSLGALFRILKTGSAKRQIHALYAIGEFGAAADAFLPDLQEFEQNTTDAAVQRRARAILAKLGRAEYAQKLLDDEQFDDFESIGAIVIPFAIERLHSTSAARQKRAADALGKLHADSDAALDALRELLASPDVDVRIFAAYALGDIGFPARRAIPNLIQGLSDDKARVRIANAKALGLIGVSSAEVENALEALQEDEDDDVRLAAKRAQHEIKFSAHRGGK